MKFRHEVSFYTLQNYCIYNNLCGKIRYEQYLETFSKYCYKDLTPENIIELAEDIYKHSDEDNEMFDFGVKHFAQTLINDGVVILSIRF